MPKQPLSVTLEEDNVIWLRARAASAKRRSLSDTLDHVVTTARLGGAPGERRSVVGTVDLAPDDPGLDRADETLQRLFETSVSRPWLVRESPPVYGRRKARRRD
jgi:hypothetical protein